MKNRIKHRATGTVVIVAPTRWRYRIDSALDAVAARLRWWAVLRVRVHGWTEGRRG